MSGSVFTPEVLNALRQECEAEKRQLKSVSGDTNASDPDPRFLHYYDIADSIYPTIMRDPQTAAAIVSLKLMLENGTSTMIPRDATQKPLHEILTAYGSAYAFHDVTAPNRFIFAYVPEPRIKLFGEIMSVFHLAELAATRARLIKQGVDCTFPEEHQASSSEDAKPQMPKLGPLYNSIDTYEKLYARLTDSQVGLLFCKDRMVSQFGLDPNKANNADKGWFEEEAGEDGLYHLKSPDAVHVYRSHLSHSLLIVVSDASKFPLFHATWDSIQSVLLFSMMPHWNLDPVFRGPKVVAKLHPKQIAALLLYDETIKEGEPNKRLHYRIEKFQKEMKQAKEKGAEHVNKVKVILPITIGHQHMACCFLYDRSTLEFTIPYETNDSRLAMGDGKIMPMTKEERRALFETAAHYANQSVLMLS